LIGSSPLAAAEPEAADLALAAAGLALAEPDVDAAGLGAADAAGAALDGAVVLGAGADPPQAANRAALRITPLSGLPSLHVIFASSDFAGVYHWPA
jgi:hypothetical protein